jgi:vancomycin resistance protein YoaR
VIAATSETASESASTGPVSAVEEDDEPRGDVENSVKAAATPVRVSTRTEPVTKTPAAPASIKPSTPAKELRTVNESAGSAFADFEEEKSGRGWVKAVVGTLATILVLGGAYAAAQYAFADEIAKNVSVAGVEIGGLSEADAAVKLNDELLPKLDEEVTLAAGDLNTTVVPSAAGITFDAEQTVEGLTGFSWSPSTLWEKLAGGEAIEPVLGVDNEQLDSAVAEVESALYVEPVSGTVSFVDGHAVATNAENGMGVDSEQVKQQLLAHLFSQTRPVPLTMQEVEPEVTQAATDAALATANKIASAAVMVEIDGQKAEIPQEAFTKNVDIKFENGQATFAFDGKKLATEVVKRTSDLLREAEDARFVFKDGKPVIEPGQAGTRIDDEQLATVFHAAATTDNRVAQVDLVETDPELSAQKLEDLGIKEKVASFSTRITNDHWRTENLRVAASRITGYLVRPGEEFDLMKVIGPVSRENGYYPAGVIVNGVHTEGMGGGLSQVATTTYNAGFFAGMTDIAHRPHTVWIPRYPEGRESTLFSGSIDMIWRNDSETGILLRAYVADGNLTVEAWGTKTYEVETTTSPRRNVTPARMTTSTAANCSYYPTGQPGFSVTVTRKVTEIATGEVVADEAKSWTYRPDNGVTCKKDESKEDD